MVSQDMQREIENKTLQKQKDHETDHLINIQEIINMDLRGRKIEQDVRLKKE